MDLRQQRSTLFKTLKADGWEPQKHYRDYKIQELRDILISRDLEEPAYIEPTVEEVSPPSLPPQATLPQFEGVQLPPQANQPDPEEMAGQRLNTKTDEDVIRVDEQGRMWLQEEVRKPAYPKPRGRRVLTYTDTGVGKETVQNGDYIETFEVAGKGAPRASEVKITLPSYQVGIYRDPRFPFKVHTYNGREGFALFEVEEYFGGAELVPASCKRTYIENDLCYDLRSVIQTIENMYREMLLRGAAK